MQPVMPSAIQRVFISALVKPMTYRGADVLLETILDQIAALLADIAYAAKARLLDLLEQHQVEAVITPMSNRKQT